MSHVGFPSVVRCVRFFLFGFFLLTTPRVPCEEFRGVWAVSTWTRAGTEEMELLFDQFGDVHFNNVMFYTYNYGTTNYPSMFFPWNNRAGVIGQDPLWNPLARGIELAHEGNLLLHAKINCYLAWGPVSSLPGDATHPANTHPEWILTGRDGEWMADPDQHLMFNPCHPGYQRALFNVCVELARDYEIDGLHFDFVRFPNTRYSFDPVTLNRFWARFGKSPDDLPEEWDQWRRDQITNWMVRVKAATRRYRPQLVYGADVFSNRSGAVQYVLQDQTRWLEMKLLDFNAAMLYTTSLSAFESLLADHLGHSHQRAIVAGIGAYQMAGDTALLGQQIQASRDQGAAGSMIYRDETLFPDFAASPMSDFLKADYFQEATGTPQFPWRTPAELQPPVFGGLIAAEPRDGMAVLRWQPADDASGPVTYTIYSSTAPAGQDFQVPDWATQNTEFLLEGLENGVSSSFVVRAEDQFGNEEGNLIELSVVPSESVSFSIEDFEGDGGLGFLDPNDSPLSVGLDPASELAATEETSHGGTSSGELQLVWEDRTGGQCFLAAQPPEPRFPDFTGWCSLWVHGAGDGTRLAAVFWDADLKRTSWVTVDWSGWRQVEWFLPRTAFAPLTEGSGKLMGGIFGGTFAGLLLLPGTEEESHLFLDDLENQMRPDPFPPDFSGLESLSAAGSVANLSWSMAMDADNPITYNVYRSSSPEGFNFSNPDGRTTQLSHSIPLVSPWTESYFVVRAEDLNGNEDDNRVVRGTLGAAPLILESFEAGTISYWNGDPDAGIIFRDPNYSGTTTGVQESSGWVIETAPVVHGSYSGRLQIDWEDTSERFCRVTTHAVRPAIGDFRGTLSVWIHGDGSHTRMAAVILDNQHEGAGDLEYERTPWITIDWVGWRKREWVLPEVSWSSQWGQGTGALEDLSAGGLLDGFIFEPGVGSSATFLFDCLQLGPLPREKGLLEVY